MSLRSKKRRRARRRLLHVLAGPPRIHDDMVDALTYAVSATRIPPGTGKTAAASTYELARIAMAAGEVVFDRDATAMLRALGTRVVAG